MKIGFFCVYKSDPIHYVLADVMIRSAKKHMPDVEIVQLTDDKSPQVVGSDSVRRKQMTQMATLRAEHQAEMQGDWLFVDTDVVFQADVRHVFKDPDFDVAVADREWGKPSISAAGTPFADRMPFNVGVLFSRQPAFFGVVRAMMKAMPMELCGWLGDQYGTCYAIQSGAFRVKVLPGSIYNYPPDDNDPNANKAAILHFKGKRKHMMLSRIVPLGLTG